jgi:hypothetical protein
MPPTGFEPATPAIHFSLLIHSHDSMQPGVVSASLSKPQLNKNQVNYKVYTVYLKTIIHICMSIQTDTE